MNNEITLEIIHEITKTRKKKKRYENKKKAKKDI